MSVNSKSNGAAKVRSSSGSPSRVPLLDNDLETSYASFTSSVSSNNGYLPEFSYISTDKTAEAIQQCEKFILNPYSNALKMIGWLPYRSGIGGSIWQAILVCIWTLCIMATMVTQILTCFKRDAFVLGDETPELPLDNASVTVMPSGVTEPITRIIRCDKHIISSLIFFDVVVLVTYYFGIYLFTRGETEYLFGLASHVFIKNSEAQSSSLRLIGTTGIFFICAIIWLIFSLAIRIMTAIATELFTENIHIAWAHLELYGALKIFLVLFSLFGFFTFDMVYIFSIMNYAVQGEMNIYLVWDIRRLIEVKKHDSIDGAIKDTRKCKEYLDVLNGKTAILTGMALFVLANLGITAIIDLKDINTSEKMNHIKDEFQVLAGIAAFLNVVNWCLLAALPFIQAARVNYWCDSLRDMATEIRGRVSAAYKDVDLLDLDSLLTYLHSIKMGASIFGIPIYPWLLYLVLVAFVFIMFCLFQVDYYSITKYI